MRKNNWERRLHKEELAKMNFGFIFLLALGAIIDSHVEL
jgi:hypothetical protein